MKFTIDSIENLEVSDDELSGLLHRVYVDEGYTSVEVAAKIFDPSLVKKRGYILVAREVIDNELSGMVIIVPPTSSAIVRAQKNECEMHLLAVKPVFRGEGLGRALIAKAIEYSHENNWAKIVLWTQTTMKVAQELYKSFGFETKEVINKNDTEFIVYERELS